MKEKRGQEDYLRVILELIDKTENIKSIDISKELKISKPSVSEMLNKLAKQNLINFKPYSKVNLTSKGKKLAEKILEKHKIIERFAGKLQAINAHEEAHKLEHHFSEDFLKKIQEFTEGKIKIEEKMPSYIS